MYRALVEGSAKHSLSGTYNGGDTKSGYIQQTAVGNDWDTILAGVQAMPTKVVPDPANDGNGTCVVTLCKDEQYPLEIRLRCYVESVEAAVEAVGKSDDREHEETWGTSGFQFGAIYHNYAATSGETGAAGNGCSVVISKLGAGAFTWGTTAPGGHKLLLDVDEGTDGYCTFDGDVSADYSDGDFVQFGASEQVHVIFPSVQNGTNTAWIWPRPWAAYSIGDALNLVSATSGLQVVCKTAAGATLQTYKAVDTGGGELPIRTLKDIENVLNHGYGTDGAAGPLAVTGYELHLTQMDIIADGLYQPGQAETVTMSGGKNATTGKFQLIISGYNIGVADFDCPDDGAEHAYSDGALDYLKVTITGGSRAFEVGDAFTCSARQATARYSWDDKANWTTITGVNDGAGAADQDTDASISIGNGMYWKVVTDYDTTPFVLDDELYFLASYFYGWRNLVNNMIRETWRTRICSNSQLLLIDLGEGNSEKVDTLAVMTHNLTTAATFIVYACGDDIEKIYGTVTTVPVGVNPTLTLNPVTTPGNAELLNGYIVFNSGGAAGKAYLAGSNTGTSCPVTGDPYTDGARDGDEYIMIPPSGYIDFTSTTGTVSVADLFSVNVASIASPTGYTSRGWVIRITDTANPDGYLEMSMLRAGEMVEIENSDGEPLCREKLDEFPVYREKQAYTATGDDIRHNSGVKQWIFPIVYPYCHADYAKSYIETMLDYCTNINRKETVVFWPDSSEDQEFHLCWIEPDPYRRRVDGDIYVMGIKLKTLEAE